jgi:hypothetical protein
VPADRQVLSYFTPIGVILSSKKAKKAGLSVAVRMTVLAKL